MIRLSDFIANFLYENGLRHVFLMTGGGAMHLNDAFGKHKGLKTIFNHHEQACAIAAESYGKLTNKPAVVNVTSGPGGLNTLTGIFGAWTDSIPVIVISGQVKYETTVPSSGIPLRQLGDQEYDIVRSVSPITKYAVMVTNPQEIKYHLVKALYLATHGRPGPVWLDIPLNVQSAMIDEKTLKSYDPNSDTAVIKIPSIPKATINKVIAHLKKAQRPVIMVGTGIRIADAQNELRTLVETLKIPIVTAWNAHDIVPENCPYYCGRPGTIGNRAGNFVVQNADFLLVLGCRLNIRQIGYNWQTFARAAYKVMVDIDQYELQKPTLKIDLPIWGDAKDFISKMLIQLNNQTLGNKTSWLSWARERKEKYPTVLPEYWQREKLINPYCFMQELSDQLPEGQIVVSANGSACVISFQTISIKPGMRLYTNSGCATMGYDLPASVGACVASGMQKIVCLAGDGSIQLNIHELGMIKLHKYPIKIFILNNNGYHSVRQTQSIFFGKPLVGCETNIDLGFPDYKKLAEAYNLRYEKCDSHKNMKTCIAQTLASDDPVLCEIMLTTEQPFAPKASSKTLPDGKIISKPLEDLAPFLSQAELRENMLIDIIDENIK